MSTNQELWQIRDEIEAELRKVELGPEFTNTQYYGPRPGESRAILNGKPRKPSKPYKDRAPSRHQPLPGEITLREWKLAECKRRGVSESTVSKDYWRGCYPELKVRHVNSKTIFVKTL